MGATGSLDTPSQLKAAALEPAATRPGRTPSRSKTVGRALAWVPWPSLVSVSLLVTGTVVFALKGSEAGDAGQALLDMVGRNGTLGYSPYVDALASAWLTVPVVAGVLALWLVVVTCIRLEQALRRAGRGSAANTPYSGCGYGTARWLASLGLAYASASTLFLILVAGFLASWAPQIWDLSQGATAAATTAGELADASARYNATVQALAGALRAGVKDPTVLSSVNYTASTLASFSPGAVPGGTLVPDGVVAPMQSGVCPSQACLNMAVYPFMGCSSCLCGQSTLTSVSSQAADANGLTTSSRDASPKKLSQMNSAPNLHAFAGPAVHMNPNPLAWAPQR
eukprot:scaffold3.g6167.t1